jgi:hypothetical protein
MLPIDWSWHQLIVSIVLRTLKQSSIQLSSIERTSIENCSLPILIKLVHTDLSSMHPNGNEHHFERVPIVFVNYQCQIYMPQFNVKILLEALHLTINIDCIEDYVRKAYSTCNHRQIRLNLLFSLVQIFAIRYRSIDLTRTSSNDLFSQLMPLCHEPYTSCVRLYPIDFVCDLLEYHHCQTSNIYSILTNAKYARIHVKDLEHWFTIDNEVNNCFFDFSCYCHCSSIDGIHLFILVRFVQQSSAQRFIRDIDCSNWCSRASTIFKSFDTFAR